MLRLTLMASHGYIPGIAFLPEQSMCRIPKDCQYILPNPEPQQDVFRSYPLEMRSNQNEGPWKPISGLCNNAQFVRIDSTIRRPVLIDVQDTHANSTLFSFGIAKQCTKHEEIFKFLTSGSSDIERDRMDLSVLSDLMGFQAMTIDLPHQPHAPDFKPRLRDTESQLIYPSSEFNSPTPVLDFVGDLVRRSEITFLPDGQVSLVGSRTEMKDVLSILAEFYLSKNSNKWRKQSLLVPQFNRVECNQTGVYASSLVLDTGTVVPLKSSAKIKHKTSQKRKSSCKAAVKDRDLYRTNYLQACESLLSIIVDKKRNGRAAIPALKKSNPELPHLLNQFSASIAGTGLAVLFSVVCKIASGRVPFCSSKLLNTGLGLGLVWLSWAVNRLRDTIISINKNSGKHGLKEEEVMKNLDRCVKEIYVRAATLMAVVVLRFA